MEKIILIDDFTKDMFGIKEHNIILELKDDLNLLRGIYGNSMKSTFINLLESNDIGYEILKDEGEFIQFKIVSYDARELRKLIPKMVDDNDEEGIEEFDIQASMWVIPSDSVKKEEIQVWNKYELFWNDEKGFFKKWNNFWDNDGTMIWGTTGTSGNNGTSGTSGSSGVGPTGVGPAHTNNGGTSGSSLPAFGTSGNGFISSHGWPRNALSERLKKFLHKEVNQVIKTIQDG